MKKTMCLHVGALLAILILMVFNLCVFADTNTTTVPGDGAAPLPQSKSEYWILIIAGVTPLIVAGIKKAVPHIPKLLLPVSTPFIGVGLGMLLNWLGNQNFGWMDLAQAGALAVFVRETVNQAVKAASGTSTPVSGG